MLITELMIIFLNTVDLKEQVICFIHASLFQSQHQYMKKYRLTYGNIPLTDII